MLPAVCGAYRGRREQMGRAGRAERTQKARLQNRKEDERGGVTASETRAGKMKKREEKMKREGWAHYKDTGRKMNEEWKRKKGKHNGDFFVCARHNQQHS